VRRAEERTPLRLWNPDVDGELADSACERPAWVRPVDREQFGHEKLSILYRQ